MQIDPNCVLTLVSNFKVFHTNLRNTPRYEPRLDICADSPEALTFGPIIKHIVHKIRLYLLYLITADTINPNIAEQTKVNQAYWTLRRLTTLNNFINKYGAVYGLLD